LRREYPDIGGTADYVSYWFRKVHDLLPREGRAGLVGTANIRSGDTRKSTLDHIVDNEGVIVEAVSSQPWSGDATVEVSIVNWTKGDYSGPKTLWLSRGTVKMEVEEITGSLSAETDLREAQKLTVNRRPQQIFQGQTPQHEDFVLTPEEARAMAVRDPRSKAALFPYLIGRDLNRTGEPSRFIIDIDAPDAMAAAGMPDGRYPLGPLDVDVVGGVARLAGQGDTAIAGGTSRLMDIVRRAVNHAGVDLLSAVIAATATPASLMGLAGMVGDLVPGCRADLIVTGPELETRAVMAAGNWLMNYTES